MNQLKELWNKINTKVDVLLYIIILGIILNCVITYFVIDAIFFRENVLVKYNIQNIKVFAAKAGKTLQEKEEIFEVEEEMVSTELPDKYQTLLESKLMIPEFERNIINIGLKTDEKTEDTKVKELPFISGISFYGSVVSEDGKSTALLYVQDKNYYAIVKKGEYIPNTDIKVEKINRFSAELSKPGYKNTQFWLPKEIYLKNLSTWLNQQEEENFIEKYPGQSFENNNELNTEEQ